MNTAPLAHRLRPRTSDAVVGQEHFWSPESALYRMASRGDFHALIFWGPPGTGKTSLAAVIAEMAGRPVRSLSAVSHGVKEIRAVLEESRHRIESGEPNLVMFMDEIHRLSKNQQDILLPALETGELKFIGATTENPSFEVNNAILSRSLVYQFKPLSERALRCLVEKAADGRLGEDVIAMLLQASGGDGRRCLNLTEAVLACEDKEITKEKVVEVFGELQIRYDRDGEGHYDTVSAMIKSIRASHPDAALHYMAVMLAGGEDPVFIARRLLIAASEDIGNANPTALLVANAGMQAVHSLGMPEARIVLGQVVTYLASSPKSNRAYLAIDKALADVKNMGSADIPLHLRNASTDYMKTIGYGKQYVYPHDDLAGAQKLTYLPAHLKGRRYYEPQSWGVEGQLGENLKKLRPRAD